MTESIDIDGSTLFFEKSGSGNPLILMHGWGCNHSTVASIAAVASRTHTVYNLDLPGFGQSPEPGGVWGVDSYTAIVEGFAKKLGLDRPVLIGHSFGGRIGLLFASRNDVDKLILVDAAGVKPRRTLKYWLKVYSFKASKFLIRTFLSSERAARIIENRRKKAGSSDYASATPVMRAILSRCVGEDLCHVMGSIKAPTLLVWGENDTATPLADALKMKRLIPEAGLVSFPGCGHYSFLDNPRQFAAVLSSFLNS